MAEASGGQWTDTALSSPGSWPRLASPWSHGPLSPLPNLLLSLLRSGPGLRRPDTGQSLVSRSGRGQEQPLLSAPVSLGSFSQLVLHCLGKQSC